tara:strand:- start:32 stop:340 length:309 start_codon:yes stop_codon:yes gene_type:complete
MSFGPTTGKPTASTGNGLGPRTQIINIAKTNITRAELTTMIQALKTEGHTVAGVDGFTADEQADNVQVALQSTITYVADASDALGVTGAATTILADFDQASV